jgi:RimJ/RimL family protein N-acetyltransferase
MSIIKTHDVTLYGGNDVDMVLRPLCDDDLPLLYKWGADPEVVYWSDTGNVYDFDEESTRSIFGSVSKNALCFIAEANGQPIGNFWLQKMNIPEVSALYPGLDVRRIEAEIGEKEYWGRGIGSAVLGMLIDYAFYGENIDVLHCFAADYNLRSQKTLLKHGFILCGEEDVEESLRAKKEYHYRFTRQDFIERRRIKVPAEKRIMFPIANLQPSQLYISDGKLRLVREWFNPDDIDNFDPIPVRLLDKTIIMTDGHTRAVAAYLAGLEKIPIYWDEGELDMRAYEIDVKWCDEENIHSPADLAGRIVPHKDYERLWRKRCMEMALAD